MLWAGWTDGPGLCAVVLPAVLAASGCQAPAAAPAPDQAGVCWRAQFQPRHRPIFTPVSAHAPDLLSCAADLDLAYLGEGAPITGAYQGHYIFIDAAAIDGAERLDLIRYPVFNVAQRADLERQLRAALAAQARRTPP